ncbi:MAG: YicC/YloC family endoribonuclease [Thermoanaerobaculia bacterium]
MQSMTGYGEAAGENARYRITARLRSVNHRSLDLVIRLPEICRRDAEAVRRRLSETVYRGRVELSVDVRFLGELEVELKVHQSAIERLTAAVEGWRQKGWVASALTAGDLLRLPGVVELEAQEERWEDEDRELLLHIVDEAIAALEAARRREGAALEPVVTGRLQVLHDVHGQLEQRRDDIVDRLGNDLRQRLEALLADVEVDPARLAQEAAVLVDKSDVREELDRLAAHLEHFRAAAAEPGPKGKRLDFIAQEIARELNTIASKARDADLAALVVQGKTACEQIREQLQNVE